MSRAKLQRSSTTTDLLVQTKSLYEAADPFSLLVEVESWRPKPQIERERGTDGRLEAFEAHYQRKPRARRAIGERVLVARLEWKRGGPLVVDTNSTERDLEIREKLALLPPSEIRFLRTEGHSMYDLLSQPVSEDQQRRAGEEEEEFSRRPEVAAKLSEICGITPGAGATRSSPPWAAAHEPSSRPSPAARRSSP